MSGDVFGRILKALLPGKPLNVASIAGRDFEVSGQTLPS